MRIVVDINHPAHVHFFKNFIREMEKRDNQVFITATEKDKTFEILNNLGFGFINLGSYGGTLIRKLINLPIIDLKMYLAIRHLNPDLFVGCGSIRAAHVSFLFRKKCINFEDTEHSREQIKLYLPFVDSIFTPSCFKSDLGIKQVRYNGYHELAYLHPNYFSPNPKVLSEFGLVEGDTLIIVRFVSWGASHDVGQYGIKDKVKFVKELEKYGRVLITSEGQLPKELAKYQIKVAPEKLHDLLYYATLCVGEGGTVAAEAAVLGTPSIFVSSLVGTMGNFIELQEKYDLLYGFPTETPALSRAINEILHDQASKKSWQIKRDRMLKDKIDVTAFMVWFIENYPESVAKIKYSSRV